MDLAERLFIFLVGAGLGFVLGYIVAHLRTIESKLDEVDHHVLHIDNDEEGPTPVERTRDDRGSWSPPPWFNYVNVMMLVILAIVVYAAFSSEKAVDSVAEKTESDKIALCESGQENRRTQRLMVDQIYALATSATAQAEQRDPPLTDLEIAQFNLYIDNVNKFRDSMYAQIDPTEICEPYVTDDNVKPATPPVQHYGE